MRGYTSISLPSALVEDLKKHLKSAGYSSIAEAVKDSIRRRIEELDARVRPGEDGTQEAVTNAV